MCVMAATANVEQFSCTPVVVQINVSQVKQKLWTGVQVSSKSKHAYIQ